VGHARYTHNITIHSQRVNPRLLGTKQVMSEDSVRWAFRKTSTESCAQWQINHLHHCCDMLLYEPWILDIKGAVNPFCGRQEGALVRFNPHKSGQPSYVFHIYLI